MQVCAWIGDDFFAPSLFYTCSIILFHSVLTEFLSSALPTLLTAVKGCYRYPNSVVSSKENRHQWLTVSLNISHDLWTYSFFFCCFSFDSPGMQLCAAVIVFASSFPHAVVRHPVGSLHAEHQVLDEGNLHTDKQTSNTGKAWDTGSDCNATQPPHWAMDAGCKHVSAQKTQSQYSGTHA